MPDERPGPRAALSLAVDRDLEGTALEQKNTALPAMHTQTAPALAHIGEADLAAVTSRESFVLSPAQGSTRPPPPAAHHGRPGPNDRSTP